MGKIVGGIDGESDDRIPRETARLVSNLVFSFHFSNPAIAARTTRSQLLNLRLRFMFHTEVVQVIQEGKAWNAVVSLSSVPPPSPRRYISSVKDGFVSRYPLPLRGRQENRGQTSLKFSQWTRFRLVCQRSLSNVEGNFHAVWTYRSNLDRSNNRI